MPVLRQQVVAPHVESGHEYLGGNINWQVGLARVMETREYRSSDEHAWTFVYAGACPCQPLRYV